MKTLLIASLILWATSAMAIPIDEITPDQAQWVQGKWSWVNEAWAKANRKAMNYFFSIDLKNRSFINDETHGFRWNNSLIFCEVRAYSKDFYAFGREKIDQSYHPTKDKYTLVIQGLSTQFDLLVDSQNDSDCADAVRNENAEMAAGRSLNGETIWVTHKMDGGALLGDSCGIPASSRLYPTRTVFEWREGVEAVPIDRDEPQFLRAFASLGLPSTLNIKGSD